MSDNDLESLLVYAFRYALGRQTYAVDDVASQIVRSKRILHKNTVDLIIREIEQAIDRNEAGGRLDIAIWENTRQQLIEHMRIER